MVLADLADALWQNTSALPNYDGVPYPATNPITQSDVSTAQQASPSSYPNVGSLTTPLTLPVAPGSSNPFTLPAPSSSPSGDPASSPSTGSSPSGSNDLCAMHPEIVACQPLGSASAPTLPASSASVSLSPVSVGGPSNPVCPAPVGVDVFGSQLLIQYQPECDFMVRVRPFILAMCGIVAAGIFVAGLRS
ncbi:virulence factor TspB C-terminal domain-related protein [Burkholderia ambifaria]|uniref:virulence factor TspB C-terminal domain-related protein n=1 Tax=Burkholderia ambifaria TaxID=152480 RepID=UPI00158B692B|nr:virulence factor TspB C-terminal domain-related protein [Burkholderia ambifaria]MBR8343554.1 hypothetical protein [Burkholderia ambifaria]